MSDPIIYPPLFKDDVTSKPIRDSLLNLKNYAQTLYNTFQAAVGAVTASSEVVNARDYFPVLLDRLRAGDFLHGNRVVDGLEVSAQAVPDMSVQISAGSAVADGVGCFKSAVSNTPLLSAPTVKRYDIVVINSSNIISVLPGNDSVDAVLPAVADTQRALAIIKLIAGQTSILDSDIIDCSAQGAWVDGRYFWSLQNAVNYFGSRANDAVDGEVVVERGEYYEELDLTGISDLTIRCKAGVNFYRGSDTVRCIKALNTFGNESERLKIIGGRFYGNGKAGSLPSVDLQYCDFAVIDGAWGDGNTSSTAYSKDFAVTNSKAFRFDGVEVYVEAYMAGNPGTAANVPIIYDTEGSDDSDSYDQPTGVFTAKYPGMYEAKLFTQFPTNTSYISKNGTTATASTAFMTWNVTGAALPQMGSRFFYLVQGDTLDARYTGGATVFQDTSRLQIRKV